MGDEPAMIAGQGVIWMTQRAVHVSLLMDTVVRRQGFLQFGLFQLVTRLLIILAENSMSNKVGTLHLSHPASPSKAVWKSMYVIVVRPMYLMFIL
jgi:hypothetical protein